MMPAQVMLSRTSPPNDRERFRLKVAKALEILEAIHPDVLTADEAVRFKSALRELQGVEANIWRNPNTEQ